MPRVATPTPGMRVLCRDAEWLVTRVDPSDQSHQNYAVHCIGADDLVRGHEAIFLTQLDTIEPVDPRKTQLVQDQSSGYRMAKLFLEAQLRQMPATGVKPDLRGMGVFKPMQFQIQTVEWALQQLRPRLLLADAVGLGKTIQVGMVLSELMRRGRANRVLVLAKKSMLTQFQSELWNRFGFPLVRLDSAGIAKLRLRIPTNKNPFEVYQRVIISIDTLKNVGSYRHFLENTRWDCVVIDEAHNVAGASVPERHLAYRLARLLSRRTDSMLLTTATPHNGKRETFGRLISLLDPSAIPDPDFKEYNAEDIRGFFLMRFKEDVREDAGADLTDRMLVPIDQTTVAASEGEEKVYAILSELRAEAMKNKSEEAWKNNVLVQYGIYKQFLSSPESCRKTLQKRITAVQAKDPESPELPYLNRMDSQLGTLSIRDSSRYQLLKRQLEAIGWDGKENSPRVLVFTEYRETQDALAAALAKDFKIKYSPKFEQQPKQVLATINGSCPDIHLMKTVEAFGTGASDVRMLLATDVASEGVNLHHQCHNIIHYDLPWSIITLIQRNGRIDRFGQTESPVLRYLRVSTRDGMLKGDESIFERLIEKVEEINRSTRQGETVLKLYDPEAEERYIAEAGILQGNVDVLEKPSSEGEAESTELESVLSQANPAGQEDFLKFLLGETEDVPTADPAAGSSSEQHSRLRLYDDKKFLLDGYRYLAELHQDYAAIEENGKLMLLNAPKDLRRRLGAPNDRGDVVFGATAVPVESWPEDNQFRLTDDPDRVELAIKSARNTSGHWSRELLATDQQPILQWITERLLMLMKRGECPHITSRKLEEGELCFCFIGQISSRAGAPLVVDAHAISFRKGGGFEHRSLRDALDAAGFDSLINQGNTGDIKAIQGPLIEAAVESSLEHMRKLGRQHVNSLLPFLRRENRRLRNWKNRRQELLESRIDKLPPNHRKTKMYRKDLEEMDAYLRDREDNWQDTYFTASTEPSTQLVLVIEGVK
ncbi:DEAD/DEAH box helicase [Aureliella helgolandensis]|uniref:RNA polymerase-associated protein RapA n=1 Tax=Aureliella helgolandensis TaxID=2527968 RepID=A0A518G9N0_9BACT|nr:helicase-related protein [Aureliella helgolandensis]QDV25305.1 RNA polymerase-associated protein RapA [Aureliella helgolandensis]